MSDSEDRAGEPHEATAPRGGFRWGVAASLALHILIAAAFLLRFPFHMPEQQKEEPVQVEIVPPPKPPEPEKKPEPSPPPPPEKPTLPEEKPPMPVLDPALRFGEKDSGPKQSDGDTADMPQDEPPEKPVEKPEPQPAPAAATEAVPMPADKPAEPPAKPAEAPKPPELTKAKTLYSTRAGGAVSTLAMRDLPRPVRVVRLCTTELRGQLRHATPAYDPDALPAPHSPQGNVVDVPRAAFRARGQWYDVAFRCEIDADATRVVSFSLRVGEAVPQDQWKARGFPEN